MLSSILTLLVRRILTYKNPARNEQKYFILAFIEPVSLIGEGEYNLNVLKEIEATDSYLALDPDVRKCQSNEPLSNCTTRKYLNTIVSKCKCLPSSLWLSNKV